MGARCHEFTPPVSHVEKVVSTIDVKRQPGPTTTRHTVPSGREKSIVDGYVWHAQ